jgi:broad specificity phosphatase PhoE
VIVCHGGVIRALVMRALGVPVGNRNLFATGPNATISVIHAHPDRWVVVSYNDSGHLAALSPMMAPAPAAPSQTE